MSPAEHLRYACQIALPGFGEAAQQRLKAARVLVVGMGGLGCPAAQYLVAAGVGQVTLLDFDAVSASNLHRQLLYTPDDLGQPKARVAAERLSRQNPHVAVRAVLEKISPENALALLAEHDLALDCTDNFEARYLINDAAVLCGKPVVYGAIYQYEGQVALWNAPRADGSRSPHYRDLFPAVDAAQVPNCAEGGIIPALAGIIGCIQANEAIKHLAGMADSLAGRLLVFDAATMQSRTFNIGDTSRVAVAALPSAEDAPTLSAEDWAAAGPGAYLLVDVRNADERAKFHLDGLHIPLPELPDRLSEIPDNQPVLFYCATGRRSAEAVRIWQKRHPGAVVFSLKNGIQKR
jgi:sulfur-carrier protein adenylyltransferase/sulfurtransferase